MRVREGGAAGIRCRENRPYAERALCGAWEVGLRLWAARRSAWEDGAQSRCDEGMARAGGPRVAGGAGARGNGGVAPSVACVQSALCAARGRERRRRRRSNELCVRERFVRGTRVCVPAIQTAMRAVTAFCADVVASRAGGPMCCVGGDVQVTSPCVTPERRGLSVQSVERTAPTPARGGARSDPCSGVRCSRGSAS